jgi:hypothetical protein
MSNKKVFLELCSDAAEQFSAGMSVKQVQSNIAYVAENYGIPMLQSIEIAERFAKVLTNLDKTKVSITDGSVAQEFLRISQNS